MSGPLRLTRGGEYVLTAATALALAHPGGRAVRALAAQEGLPPSFLAKLLRPLVRRRLLEARPGAAGGVRLGRPATAITLLEVLEACEGAFDRATCVFDSARECPGSACELFCDLRRAEDETTNRLRAVTLAQLAETYRRHPRHRGKP
jgi:Rrf2 family protein